MADQPHIVIVEDDDEIRSLVSEYLSGNGCTVTGCRDAAALDACLDEGVRPDLIVLDIMLPGEDGLSICRRMRANTQVPILMLTARGDEIDRIIGLEIGADDYLAKPFNPRELLARLRAILRRNGQASSAARGAAAIRRVVVGHLVVDVDGRAVRTDAGLKIDLTSAEFELLSCFIERPGRVLTRDQLMDWTRGREASVFDRTIDVQMSRLRKKIASGDEPLITTVRGKGYILTARVQDL